MTCNMITVVRNAALRLRSMGDPIWSGYAHQYVQLIAEKHRLELLAAMTEIEPSTGYATTTWLDMKQFGLTPSTFGNANHATPEEILFYAGAQNILEKRCLCHSCYTFGPDVINTCTDPECARYII